jgi:predicted outer membrane repeat protein
MDKLKSKILFILLISIILCSVSSIAAAEVNDAGVSDDVFDLSNDIETAQSESPNDVLEVSDSQISEDEEILAAPIDEEPLSADDDEVGTFTDLYNLIQTGNEIDLTKNYKYNSAVDGINDNVIRHKLYNQYSTQQKYAYYIGLDKNIVINGNGRTIDGNGLCALFVILDGANSITLNDLNIVNCVAQPSKYNDPDYFGSVINARNKAINITVNNCNFTGNVANPDSTRSRGGVIYAASSSTITIKDSIFKENKAYYGSAIYTGGKLTISNTKILDNQAHARSLSIDYLNPRYDIWGEVSFDGFIGNFRGYDNLINGIYTYGSGPISFTDVTYLGETGETTTSVAPTVRDYEAGIPIHVIITQNGNIVKDIVATTNSTGGYIVTEEELQLDYGTYSAYAVHEADAYYTYIKSSTIRDFNSYMYVTTLTNESVTGFAGEKANVTFTVTYRDGRYNVPNGKVIVTIGNKNYTATVSNGKAKVEIVLPEESGDYKALYDGTGYSYWNSTGTLKITILHRVNTTTEVTASDILVGENETIKYTVTGDDGETPEGNVNITIIDGDGAVVKTLKNVPVANGTVGVVFSDLPKGEYTVNVTYGGYDVYNPSNGTATFTVTKATTAINNVSKTGYVGEDIEITFTVTAGDKTVNGGTVSFEIEGETKTATVVNGEAKFTLNMPHLFSKDNIEVTYSGTDAYSSAVGHLNLTINRYNTTITNVSKSGKVGEEINITFTVMCGDEPVNEGQVWFDANGTNWADVVNGEAKFTLTIYKEFQKDNIVVTYVAVLSMSLLLVILI